MKLIPNAKSLLCATALLMCGFAASASAQTNLITNGGFEQGFSGWTLSAGNSSFAGNDPAFAHSGTRNAFLESTNSIGFLSQTFNTVVGQQYSISFFYANDEADPTNYFAAFFNGTQGFAINGAPVMGYQNVTFNAIANSTTSTLQFQFRHDVDFFRLDTVSVIPEPSTNALMILSAAGVLGVVQYRRVKARRSAADA